MSESSESEPRKGGGPLPMVAALLVVVLVGQVIFMFTRFKNAPPAPAGTPGASVGAPKVPLSGTRGPAPVQSGGAGMVAPQGPTAVRTPFLGPAPTVDTRTWILVPGDFLLGALLKVDGNADTRFKPDQLKETQKFLGEVADLGRWTAEAMDKLVLLAPKVLEPDQLRVVPSTGEALKNVTLDLDSLVARLKATAGSTSAAPPAVSQDDAPSLSPMQVLAVLDKLEAEKKLTVEQAAKLQPAVADAVEKLKAQAAMYPRVVAILDQAQLAYFLQVLKDMRSGKLDPSVVQVNMVQAKAYFSSRATQ